MVEVKQYKVGTQLKFKESATISYLALDNRKHLQKTVASNQQVADSDLVSGVYEGGLKVWECSFDLADYVY
jgi:hypothetical protein